LEQVKDPLDPLNLSVAMPTSDARVIKPDDGNQPTVGKDGKPTKTH